MRSVSPQTAQKSRARTIREGYLTGIDNPIIRRSRLIAMTAKLKARFGSKVDYAPAEFRKAI
jgi:hypothetical protein